jgi:hypothetical protein
LANPIKEGIVRSVEFTSVILYISLVFDDWIDEHSGRAECARCALDNPLGNVTMYQTGKDGSLDLPVKTNFQRAQNRGQIAAQGYL